MTRSIVPSRFKQQLARGSRALATFVAGQAGNTFMFFGLALPMALGMAGLGFDATIWYMTKRQNQTIADNASLAGIMALNRDGATIVEATAAVVDAAARQNFVDGTDGDIQVAEIATCGPGGTITQCLEVIVIEERPLYLASFVMDQQTTQVAARSVGAIIGFGEHCILALDKSMDKAIDVTGTADVELACGIASNSSSEQSIYIGGVANLTADPAQAYGDIYESANATLTTETPPQPLSERLEDPYYDLVEGTVTGVDLIPSLSGACKSTDQPVKLSGVVTIDPNHPIGDIKAYCGGLKINAGAVVTMNPGVYVIDDGDFFVAGGATVTGTDVTIILTAWEPSTKTNQVGNFIIQGGADVKLSAPTTGDYAGLLFIQDPDAPTAYSGSTETNLLTGGAEMNLTGAIYTPTRAVDFAGNAAPADGGSSCTQIVAKQVTLSGTAHLENDSAACDAAGVKRVAQTRVRMVE